jgi:hypothetical protein
MDKTANAAIGRIEEQISNIEQRTIDAVLNWVSRLLSRQERADYRPRDGASDDSLMQLQTPVRKKKRRYAGPS